MQGCDAEERKISCVGRRHGDRCRFPCESFRARAVAGHQRILSDETDIVGLAAAAQACNAAIEVPDEELDGSQSRARTRCGRSDHAAAFARRGDGRGATLIDPGQRLPQRRYKLGRDVTVRPLRRISARMSSIERRASRSGHSAISPAPRSETGAIIGPFARLRPGTEIGEDAHIGNFVEVKKTDGRTRRQSQPSELYRRCEVGERRQYRRRHDHLQLRRLLQARPRSVRTHSSAPTRSLVAPVKIGDGAYIGAGSGHLRRRSGGCAASAAAGRSTSPAARRPSARQRRRRNWQGRKRAELMCGIVGIIGKSEVAPLLIEALRRLEYRGYDSAPASRRWSTAGLSAAAPRASSTPSSTLKDAPVQGNTGIGHTRWATHGVPAEPNAHPIATRPCRRRP